MLSETLKVWKLRGLVLIKTSILRWSLLLMTGVLLAVLVFGRYGWLNQRALKKEILALQEKIHQQQARKTRRLWQINALKEDQQYIEHLVRKRMGLVIPTDRIYR